MEKTLAPAKVHKKRKRLNRARVIDSLELYVLLIIPVLVLFFMAYKPWPGILIAWQDYKLGRPFFGEGVKWVGWKHFKDFINGMWFERLIGNTLRISIKTLLINFPIPIAFALLLNEIKHMKTKKIVQTISYLPHFISTVIVAGMVISFVGQDGIVNQIIKLFGGRGNTAWLNKAEAFDTIYISTIVWIGFGFSSILYMSAISGIDQELYEAARLDGASRWQQCIYITLPGILPTVSICLIMDLGAILSANTDLILNLFTNANARKSDVIGTYVYRMGLGASGGTSFPKYSFGQAISLFTSIINITMLFIANKISTLLTDTGLW